MSEKHSKVCQSYSHFSYILIASLSKASHISLTVAHARSHTEVLQAVKERGDDAIIKGMLPKKKRAHHSIVLHQDKKTIDKSQKSILVMASGCVHKFSYADVSIE